MEYSASTARNSRGAESSRRANPATLGKQMRQPDQRRCVRPQNQKRKQRRGIPRLSKFGDLAPAFEHRHHVPEISGSRVERSFQQHPERQILDRRIQPVAFHVIRFERRRAAGGMRIAMHHGGPGT